MEIFGICGTDKRTFQGFTKQYSDRKLEFQIIQGREDMGTIAAIGGTRSTPTSKESRCTERGKHERHQRAISVCFSA